MFWEKKSALSRGTNPQLDMYERQHQDYLECPSLPDFHCFEILTQSNMIGDGRAQIRLRTGRASEKHPTELALLLPLTGTRPPGAHDVR